MPPSHSSATVSSQDRGLLYGDGVFSTMAIIQHKALNLPEHLQRLHADSARLGFPTLDIVALQQKILQFITAEKSTWQQRGVLKCWISRGQGGRGYKPPAQPQPNIILSRHTFPEYSPTLLQQGGCIRLSKLRLGRNPALAGIKHLNRLENVLAKQEWDDPNIIESLLLDSDGLLIEGTMSNLFWRKGTTLYTPHLQQAGVAGIIRGHILKQAQTCGLDIKVDDYPLTTLEQAEEVFLSNSLLGIASVKQLNTDNILQWKNTTAAQCLRQHLIQHNMIAPT